MFSAFTDFVLVLIAWKVWNHEQCGGEDGKRCVPKCHSLDVTNYIMTFGNWASSKCRSNFALRIFAMNGKKNRIASFWLGKFRNGFIVVASELWGFLNFGLKLLTEKSRYFMKFAMPLSFRSHSLGRLFGSLSRTFLRVDQYTGKEFKTSS